MNWQYGKPKDGQKVWVLHKNDPVKAIFCDIGSLGFYIFTEYGDRRCSYWKCGGWIPDVGQSKNELPSVPEEVELPF